MWYTLCFKYTPRPHTRSYQKSDVLTCNHGYRCATPRGLNDVIAGAAPTSVRTFFEELRNASLSLHCCCWSLVSSGLVVMEDRQPLDRAHDVVDSIRQPPPTQPISSSSRKYSSPRQRVYMATT